MARRWLNVGSVLARCWLGLASVQAWSWFGVGSALALKSCPLEAILFPISPKSPTPGERGEEAALVIPTEAIPLLPPPPMYLGAYLFRYVSTFGGSNPHTAESHITMGTVRCACYSWVSSTRSCVTIQCQLDNPITPPTHPEGWPKSILGKSPRDTPSIRD